MYKNKIRYFLKFPFVCYLRLNTGQTQTEDDFFFFKNLRGRAR